MADEDEPQNRRHLTINDIARMAGVSKKTVSRVINNSALVRQDTREQVEAVIGKTGYVPDPQARGLAFRRSFLIGMIYDNPNPQYVVNMQLGLLDGMANSGFELLVHPCQRSAPDFLSRVRGFVVRQKLYGVVLTPSVSEDERVTELLRALECPYIRIASVALDDPAAMMLTNDSVGGLLAARHLLELGHRRLGFVAGPPAFRSSHERLTGFLTGLSEAGLTLDDSQIARGAYTFESGVEAGAQLLSRGDRPTAIFAANDEMAAGVLRTARDLGLYVPRDLSVVGYDDFLATRLSPALTTIRTPTREIGRCAARRLIGNLAAPDPDAVMDAEKLKPVLVVRESTAPPQ